MEARHRLIINLFVLCALTPALRSNVSLAIITRMTFKEEKQHTYNITSVNHTSGIDYVKLNFSQNDLELGVQSFFWGNLITQFFAGLLAFEFGGKWVGGWAMVSRGIISIALPQSITWGRRDFLIFTRILQGISSSLVLSSFALMGKWIPPKERAFLCSICLSGIPLGKAITILCSSYLTPVFGWSSVFYVPGILTLVYFPVWCCMVHESPHVDPNISFKELDYLKRSLQLPNQENKQNKNEPNNKARIPWKAMFTSVPVWAVFISQFCTDLGDYIMASIETPKLFQSEFQLDLQMYSSVSALRHLCQFIFMNIVGFVSDFLIGKKIFSVLTARKICNSFGQWGYALLLAGLMFLRWRDLSVVFWICYIFAGMMNGAVFSGSRVNIIDISPKHSPVVNGMIISSANIFGLAMGYGTRYFGFCENETCTWYVWLTGLAILNILGNLIFILGADASLQYWNRSEQKITASQS